MSNHNPYCPTCQGRGWYEGPYYGDLEPKIVTMVCEDCLPHSKPTKAELLFLASIIVLLFAFLIVGAQ